MKHSTLDAVHARALFESDLEIPCKRIFGALATSTCRYALVPNFHIAGSLPRDTAFLGSKSPLLPGACFTPVKENSPSFLLAPRVTTGLEFLQPLTLPSSCGGLRLAHAET